MFRESIDLGPGRRCAVWRMAWRPSLHPRHCHVDLECNLTLTGKAVYIIGDRRYEMRPGTLVWLFPGQEHQLISRDRDHVMDIAVFTPDLTAAVAESLADPRISDQTSADVPLRTLGTTAVRALAWLGRAVEAAAGDPALANAAGEHLLIAAWRAFHSREAASTTASLHPAVAQTIELLGRSPAATRAALARAARLSPGRLGRIFHAEMGVTLALFRNRLRVDRFLQAAGQGRDLTSAALEAGFGSYSQCHAVIKAVTGLSPQRAVAGLAPSG
jgi:AraC-like DNA-binding protein